MSFLVHGRLDGARWNGAHTAITAALGIGWLLDAFEVTIVNNVISVFKRLWHLSNLQASWVLSIWFVGLMIGAFLFGYLADRYGRKRLFLATLVLYGSFTFLTAFAWNYSSLMLLRLVTAVGVGAEYAAINAAISEFIPARHRGKANAAVMNFWSLGAIVAALASLLLLNHLPLDLGWRVAFCFGALVAVFAALARRYIPESPRWLLARGKAAAAEAVVADIERGRLTGPSGDAAHAAERKEGSDRHGHGIWRQTRELMRRHPGRLALGAVLDFSEAAGYYGLFAFLALFILPQVRVGAGFVPWFYLIGNLGALAGGVAVTILLDKAGRKVTVTGFYALAALGVLVLAATTMTGDWRWVLAGFTLCNLFATGAWVSAYPTFSELFPTHLRSTGIGLSVAFGRIGAFAAPLLLTSVADAHGMLAALGLLAAFWLLGACAMLPWCYFGIEGKAVSLEALSG